MPGVTSHPPAKPPNVPELKEGHVVDLVSKEELQKEVYSKSAIDQTLKDIRDLIQKQQDQINELMDSKIQLIHTSPWQKFKNLFRGD